MMAGMPSSASPPSYVRRTAFPRLPVGRAMHRRTTARALRHACAAFLLLAGAVAVADAPAASAESTLNCRSLPRMISSYLQTHLKHRRLDTEIRRRTLGAYLDSLDPSKTLFLASEAQAFEDSGDDFFQRIARGDCAPLEAPNALALERYQEMEELVRSYLGSESFALDGTLELVLDPDDRGFQSTHEARRDLVRRLVQFQLSNYLVDEVETPVAKERLTHRYELMTKRASERDSSDLYSSLLDAFARSLDPHSSYFSADALEDFQIGMALSLEGIGVGLSSRDGYPVVEQVIPGGATDRANALKPDDKIVAVAQDGELPVSVVDMDLRDVVRLIRGKKGTAVRLTVLREAETAERFSVSIIRDTIDLKEQAASLRFEERAVDGRKLKLAVIELRSFYGAKNPRSRRSTDDMRRLLSEVREANADGLLLDLSRNGGGNLEFAVAISGFFIRKGGVVAIREASGRAKILRDPDDDLLFDGPMVVLASRLSASASEILAGALKDYDRAVIVGDRHTFGKGTVQTVIPLTPGLGALKVTTAMFFRPGGTSTQLSGVEPHVVVPSLYDRDRFGERHQDYALPGQSMVPFLPEGDATRKRRGYTPLDPTTLSELSRRSQARVAGNEGFDEVAEKLAEAENNEGVLVLSEVLERGAAAETGSETGVDESTGSESTVASGDAAIPPQPRDTTADDDDELSIQAQESLNILADLIALSV